MPEGNVKAPLCFLIAWSRGRTWSACPRICPRICPRRRGQWGQWGRAHTIGMIEAWSETLARVLLSLRWAWNASIATTSKSRSHCF